MNKRDINAPIKFNSKVDRLSLTKFYNRYKDELPEVVMKFKSPTFETSVGTTFTIQGEVESWVSDFDRDDIEAFVLTYRILTQRNDGASIGSIAKVYESSWVPEEARRCFGYARAQLNDYLDNHGTTIRCSQGNHSKREVIETFIYGGLAHTNDVKEQKFLSWTTNPAVAGMFWVEFMGALKHAMVYLLYFKDLNVALISQIPVCE